MKLKKYKNPFIPYILFLTFFFSFTSLLPAQEGGYVTNVSVTKGDTVEFHISTSISPFNLTIFRIQDIARYVTVYNSIQGGIQPVLDSAYAKGCSWQVTYKLKVPDNWAAGVYRADFPVSNSESRGILFIVKERTPGTLSKMLLILSTNTWQAYNDFGGKSFYDNFSADGKRSYKISTQRPAAAPLGTFGSADFYKYEYKFINWAFYKNIKLEYAVNYDVEINPDLLSHYNIVFIVGHNEYWSRGERHQYEDYVNNGGKLMILSGNTCWWQVRFEDNGKTIVCYKDKALDPLTGIADSLVTVNWWAPPVNYPENILTGVNFRYGGYVNSGTKLPASEGYGDYAAINTYNWIYNGTGLKDGDEFGYDKAIVGYETDGAIYKWQNGIPVVTGEEQTPLNFRILGISPAISYDPTITNSHATMGMYHAKNGGVVFNASTTDWVDGLLTDSSTKIYPDPIVEKITENVINKFIENRFPPEILNWYPFKIDSAFINKETIFLNKRNILVLPDSSVKLSVYAADPFNQQVKFYWAQDGTTVGGQDSTLLFQNKNTGSKPLKNKISVFAYNSKDTASISWNIFNTQLMFSSDPVTYVKPGKGYSYKADVFNYYNDLLQYQLHAPNWLSIDDKGNITGNAPSDTGSYPITILVTNQHNQFDTQIYTLKVNDAVTSVQEPDAAVSYKLYQNYPNPFNPSTIINYTLPERAFVTLKIYNAIGQEVAVLINEEKEAGSYQTVFNTASIKNGLPSGVYFYRLNANGYIINRKMLLLK